LIYLLLHVYKKVGKPIKRGKYRFQGMGATLFAMKSRFVYPALRGGFLQATLLLKQHKRSGGFTQYIHIYEVDSFGTLQMKPSYRRSSTSIAMALPLIPAGGGLFF
jgi:hypothetical protein